MTLKSPVLRALDSVNGDSEDHKTFGSFIESEDFFFSISKDFIGSLLFMIEAKANFFEFEKKKIEKVKQVSWFVS